jgi:hypothetical protein
MQKTKEELLQIIADCSQNVPEGYKRYSYSDLTSKNIYLSEDSFCSEEEEFIENDDYTVQVESVRGAEGDGAEMFLTVKITSEEDKGEYFIEFFGRYSSWDSSCYHRSYVVEPYQEMVTFYREVK